MISKNRSSLLLFTLPFLVLGCTEEVSPLEEVTVTTLSASGGTAMSAGRELALEVSAGALARETKISIRTDRKTHVLATVERYATFELTADPPITQLGAPVTLAITVVPKVADRTFVIANFDGPDPVALAGSTYDPSTRTAKAPLAHFSTYGAWTTSATVASDCPEVMPEPQSPCTSPELVCNFGDQCCCGVCHPGIVGSCVNGKWSLLQNEWCFDAGCPDATTPDAGMPDGSAASCVGEAPRCIACGADVGWSAVCSDGQWICESGFLATDFERECVGKVGGRCNPDDSCQAPAICGNDHRCWLSTCSLGDQIGRCRDPLPVPGCCDDQPIDGLCSIPPMTFHTCPLGTVEVSTCTMASTSTTCAGS